MKDKEQGSYSCLFLRKILFVVFSRRVVTLFSKRTIYETPCKDLALREWKKSSRYLKGE
jgi:hypothetical protein